MMTFRFFSDASLSTPLDSLAVTLPATGGSVDRMVYLGSTTALKLLEAASNPGVALVTVSVADTTPGSGINASHIKLAVVQDDLDYAVAGTALELGAMIMSGPGSGSEIWVRIETPALANGVYTEISLTTNDVIEVNDV